MIESRRLWAVKIPDYPLALRWVDRHGTRLAVLSAEGSVGVVDGIMGTGAWRQVPHSAGACALDCSPVGDAVATGGQDGRCVILDSAHGETVAEIGGGAAWVEHVAWSPDGQWLALAAGRQVRVVTASGSPVRTWTDHPSTVASIAWRSDSKQLAVAHYGGVTLWHPDGDTPLRRLERKGSILTIAWHPRGRFLAAGCQDQAVQVWNMRSDDHLYMSGYHTKVATVAWDSEGRYLATAGGPGGTCWDYAGKGPSGSTPIALAEHRELLTTLAWSPQAPLISTGDRAGRTNIWRIAGKRHEALGRIDRLAPVTAQLWSPGGSRLVVAHDDGTIEAFDVLDAS